MPFDDLYKKIVALQEFNIVKETEEIINNHSEFLADLLAQQLAIGRDGKNEPVTIFGRDFYSDRTIAEKQRYGIGLGKVTDRITTYMSGAFYHAIRVKTNMPEFELISDVPYFADIITRSGTIIMELNQENLEIFSTNILIPELQERFKRRFDGL